MVHRQPWLTTYVRTYRQGEVLRHESGWGGISGTMVRPWRGKAGALRERTYGVVDGALRLEVIQGGRGDEGRESIRDA